MRLLVFATLFAACDCARATLAAPGDGPVSGDGGTELVCDEGLDDDGDGLTDCSDVDCLDRACACIEGDCRATSWADCSADTAAGSCTGRQTREAPRCGPSHQCELRTESRACPLSNTPCGSPGSFSACVAGPARCTGTHSLGAGACVDGVCSGETVVTESCLMQAQSACGAATSWSACHSDAGYDCSGLQTRTLMQCDGDGGCLGRLETQTCTLADGTGCGAPTSLGQCGRADPLSCSGTRTVQRPACSSGACTGTRVDSAPCDVPSGTSCGMDRCCGLGYASYARCPAVAGAAHGCGSEFYDGTCDGSGGCTKLCNRVVCWNGAGHGECGVGGEDFSVHLACPL